MFNITKGVTTVNVPVLDINVRVTVPFVVAPFVLAAAETAFELTLVLGLFA